MNQIIKNHNIITKSYENQKIGNQILGQSNKLRLGVKIVATILCKTFSMENTVYGIYQVDCYCLPQLLK